LCHPAKAETPGLRLVAEDDLLLYDPGLADANLYDAAEAALKQALAKAHRKTRDGLRNDLPKALASLRDVQAQHPPESAFARKLYALWPFAQDPPQKVRLILANALHSMLWSIVSTAAGPQASPRFSLFHLAAQKMGGLETPKLKQKLLDHFDRVNEILVMCWGEDELKRIGDRRLEDLPNKATRTRLVELVGAEQAQKPVADLEPEALRAVRDELGRRLLREARRQSLLWISNSHWVDYLTMIEGVRTSIGLEAYAQRDPLVVYKSRAFDAFRALQRDIANQSVWYLFNSFVDSKSALRVYREKEDDQDQDEAEAEAVETVMLEPAAAEAGQPPQEAAAQLAAAPAPGKSGGRHRHSSKK
jgi:hypothetical protein